MLFHIEWVCQKNRRKCKSATILLHCGDSLSLSCIVWNGRTTYNKGEKIMFLNIFYAKMLRKYRNVNFKGFGHTLLSAMLCYCTVDVLG